MMLGSGMPVAIQMMVAGLVSFTTTVTVVMSTSGGSDQGGEREGCSQLCMHSTCHKLLRYVRMYILDQSQACSSCAVSIQQLTPHVDQCVLVCSQQQTVDTATVG